MWKNLPFIVVVIGLFGLSFTVTFLSRKTKPQPVATVEQPTSSDFIPTLPKYDLLPPSQVVNAKVESVVGEVLREPRESTEQAALNIGDSIIEGEKIVTGTNSKLILTFDSGATLNISSETTLSFASMNPQNFLLVLSSGTVSLQTDSTLKTISIRSLRGLFSITKGQAEIKTNTEDGIIELNVQEGTGQVGYIDAENNTQMISVAENEKITFDNNSRSIGK